MRMPNRSSLLVGAVALVLSASLAVALASTVPISGEVTLTTNSGVAVTISGASELGTDPFVDDETVALATDIGNVTVSGSGPANLTITQPTGTQTVVSALNVSQTAVTVDAGDKSAITVQGGTDSLSFREPALDDGTVDLRYTGSATTTTLTLRGLPEDTAIAARNSTALLDKGRTGSDGTLTVDLPTGTHDVTLVTTTITAPEFSAADPVETQSTTPTEIAVNVSDTDFPADQVNVTLSLDGTEQANTTLTADGRVSTSIGSLTPGTHQWTVEATDEYGNTEIQTYTFGVPSNITVYNESAPDDLINTTEVTATVYTDGEEIFTRTTTNGTVPLRGLPATEDLVVELSAANYTTRTVIVEDLAIQQRYYLLPETVASVEMRFELDDPTGQFPSGSSQLFIKRPLTVSGNTTYQTIVADEFGPQGFTTTLEEDVRYRLTLKNRDGDVRVLGAYEAVVAETVTLRPGGLELTFNETSGYTWDYRVDNSTGTPTITFEFADPEQATTNLQVTIHERGNTSNTLSGYPVTYPGPLGTVTISEPLTDAQANTTWVVEWEADRNGQSLESGARDAANPRLFTALPAWVRLWSGLGVVLITGALFSRANVNVGAVVTALTAGIFWWIGWLGTAATGASVALGLCIAGLFWAADRGGL